MLHPQTAPGASAVRSAWGSLMAEVKPEDGRYPQLNLNTGVSIGLAAMFAGSFFWSFGVRQDVGYHELRIAAVESTVKELRTSLDSTRLLSAQAETRLENRLTRMEIILQDIRDNRRMPAPP